jgi:FlaG/FlaF family flagellin (archaellin)
MRYRIQSESGVSEVVGEMLMIALVIILISVFSVAIFTFMPVERDPSVNIMVAGNQSNITLWHKGGDWVKAEDLTVIIGNNSLRRSFTLKNAGIAINPSRPVFDLGSNITVFVPGTLAGDETVTLTTPRTVIFSGGILS